MTTGVEWASGEGVYMSDPNVSATNAAGIFADIRSDEGVAVLGLDGDVDLANTDEIMLGVEEILGSNQVKTLILDLGRVDFMDSTGLRMLWEVRQKAQDARAKLVLRTPSHAVQRLLQLTGMHRIFQVEALD